MINITMFGNFSLSSDNAVISSTDNRSKKIWLLLAYILCNRNRAVHRQELISLLWSDENSSSNPESALKTSFHRVRSSLDALYPKAGHELITFSNGGYSWNNDIPVTIDIDVFNRLCTTQSDDTAGLLEDRLQALNLYKDGFLSDFSSETWVIPIATYFQNLYIKTVFDTMPLLIENNRFEEACHICRNAIQCEPYDELLVEYLMTALIKMGDNKSAVKEYEDFSLRLYNDLGIKPSQNLSDLQKKASASLSVQTFPMDVVIDHLKEIDAKPGALLCEYDHFKILCYVEARSMQRSGKATHVALLSVSDYNGKDLPKNSLERVMDNLSDQIRTALRRGDTYARCSLSQFIIMLPQANYENSCMVCRRVVGNYIKKHPSSKANITFAVQPLSLE